MAESRGGWCPSVGRETICSSFTFWLFWALSGVDGTHPPWCRVSLSKSPDSNAHLLQRCPGRHAQTHPDTVSPATGDLRPAVRTPNINCRSLDALPARSELLGVLVFVVFVPWTLESKSVSVPLPATTIRPPPTWVPLKFLSHSLSAFPAA